MRDFIKSKTFLMIVSVACAILLWIYVVYEVNPVYEVKISDVPVKAINVASAFGEGTIKIADKSNDILSGSYTIDVKIKGKRNVVSSIDREDVVCTVDMYNVNKSGLYTLKPTVELGKSNVEIAGMSPSSVTINVENIEQRTLKLELKKTGSLPDGYSLENVKFNSSLTITGAESVVIDVGSAYVNLNCSLLTPDDSEKSLKITILDRDGNQIDNSLFTGLSREYENVSFSLYTQKEVTLTLRPQYKDMNKLNNYGQNVFLSVNDESGDVKSNGGIEIKVKLEGTEKGLEKYLGGKADVYTEPIDVSEIYYNKVLPQKYKAANLAGNVKYVSVPEVEIKATIGAEGVPAASEEDEPKEDKSKQDDKKE